MASSPATSETLIRFVRLTQNRDRPAAADPPRTGGENAARAQTCARSFLPATTPVLPTPPRSPGESIERWTEVTRDVEVVRVEASDGSGAWVDVEQATRLLLRDPAGRLMELTLRP